MKSHYDLLSVAANAPDDEIKKAFRREIARYHPDKVQHLGKEFQDMAAGVAADLTEAYRVLMDPALRARYDQDLRGRAAAPAPSTAPVQPSNASSPDVVGSRPEPPPAEPATARSSAGLDFVRRAALTKIREAVQEVLANADAMPAAGFDVAVVSRPKKGLFRKADESVCLLVKFVARIDADAVAAFWPAALKVSAPGASGCVLLLAGPEMATARELADAVTGLRRKVRRPGPVLVPVDVRDWETLFPPDTPAVVRSLIQRLKHDAR